MARRSRGFFAELQHQAAVAEKERQRNQAAAVRGQVAAQREVERARAAASRAASVAGRADAKSVAAAEREAKRLHDDAQKLEAERLTAQIQSFNEEVEGVLAATLEHDDHVDLETLRLVAEHPAFSSRHGAATPVPLPIEAGREPVFEAPPEPRGMKALFGGKVKHADAVAGARRQFEAAHDSWRREVAEVPMKQLAQMQTYQETERLRLEKLAGDRRDYDLQCDEQTQKVDAHNKRLDEFISALRVGDKTAVEEYFGIVLGNSVYPGDLDVSEELAYDPSTRELDVRLLLPLPSELPKLRGYKYVKAQDSIVEVPKTATDLKSSYASFVHQVALRTLHEVWEADRLRLVDTISLVAGTENLSPATGQEVYTPLVAVAVDRLTFESINLAHIQPAESLRHLRAVVSKNPIDLTPIDLTKGIRG